MNVDAGIDYRLRTLTQAHLWLSPLNNDTREQMDKLWLALAGAPRAAGPTLEINHRELPTLGVENQTLAASFATLCVDARSQHDYIALSRLFHTVMLFDVPVMTAQLESEARRFIALVDEFYERHVKLVVSAAVPLYDIYRGERLKFEFQRCLSSAGDAERRVPQTSAYALTGDFSGGFRAARPPRARPEKSHKGVDL